MQVKTAKYFNWHCTCGNQRLFRRVFRSHRCIQSTVFAELPLRVGLNTLHRLIRYSCIYKARMSPTFNRHSAIRHIKRSKVIKIWDGIIFDGTTTQYCQCCTPMWRLNFILPLFPSPPFRKKRLACSTRRRQQYRHSVLRANASSSLRKQRSDSIWSCVMISCYHSNTLYYFLVTILSS